MHFQALHCLKKSSLIMGDQRAKGAVIYGARSSGSRAVVQRYVNSVSYWAEWKASPNQGRSA